MMMQGSQGSSPRASKRVAQPASAQAAVGADKQRTGALATAAWGGAFQVAMRELLLYYVHLLSCFMMLCDASLSSDPGLW